MLGVGDALSGSPPLRPTGLVLGRDGHFYHEGEAIAHPGLRRVLERAVCFAEPEGVFIVQVGHFRGQIELEDTPFFVHAYSPETGEIDLSDLSSERLDPASLRIGEDGVLCCTVKGRFPARFSQAAQAHLLLALDAERAPPVLRMGAREVSVPGLAVA